MAEEKRYAEVPLPEEDKAKVGDALEGFSKIEVPRKSGGRPDPYWFSAEGFCFRSIPEVKAFVSSGKSVLSLKPDAFKMQYGYGKIKNKQDAIDKGLVTQEQMLQITGGSAAGFGGGGGAAKASVKRKAGEEGAAAEGGAGSGKRSRTAEKKDKAEKPADKAEKKEKTNKKLKKPAMPPTWAMPAVLSSMAIPPAAAPCLEIYQKNTHLGVLRLSDVMGSDLLDKLPAELRIFQRTAYHAVREVCCPIVEEAVAHRETCQGAVMIARLVPVSGRGAEDVSELSEGLSNLRSLLNSKERVAFCTTDDSNCSVYLIPEKPATPGNESSAALLDSLLTAVKETGALTSVPPTGAFTLVVAMKNATGTNLRTNPQGEPKK